MGMFSVQDRVKGLLGYDDTVKHRASMLPLVRTQDDKVRFGYPSAVIGALEALALPGHVAQGGSYTPQDVTNMALDVGTMSAPVGMATAPRGALAIGGAKRGGLTDQQLKNLHSAAKMGVGLGRKSINKTVRNAGIADDDLDLAKNIINEMYGKITQRAHTKPKTDPLIIKAMPHSREFRLKRLKNEKEVRDMAQNLGWRKDSLSEALKAKNIGHDWDGTAQRATLEAIQREAKKRGLKIQHSSGKGSAKSASSLYIVRPDGTEVRVSDHRLPDTPQRQYARELHGGPRWDSEYILPRSLKNKRLDEIFDEIMGSE